MEHPIIVPSHSLTQFDWYLSTSEIIFFCVRERREKREREEFNAIFIWTFGRRVVKRDLAGLGHYSVQQIDDLVIKNTILKFFHDVTTNSISMLFYSMLSHAISFNAVCLRKHIQSPISFDNPNSDACKIILHLPDS